MTSSINPNSIIDGDSTPHAEVRQALVAAKNEIEAMQKRTGLYGSSTGAQAVTGDNAAATEIDLDLGRRVNVTSDGSDSANDIDVPAGAHGDELFVTLATKASASDTVTVTPASGVTISTADLSATADGTLAAVASVTFDTAGEWVWLRYVVDRWIVVATTGAVA